MFEILLHGSEPHQRKMAARKLARAGNVLALPVLVEALDGDSNDDVRASIVLALGLLGGATAEAALTGLKPRGPQESEAVRKALGRIRPSRPQVAWRVGLTLPNIMAEIPEGLEHACSRFFAKAGWPAVETERSGLVRFTGVVTLDCLLPPPRWVYGIRMMLAEAEPNATHDAALCALLSRTVLPWTEWLEPVQDSPLPYRFSVEGRKLPRSVLKAWLDQCRAALAPQRLIDNPSAYVMEVVVSFLGPRPRLYVRPTFVHDDRFAYRVADVGASMNPIVAAALVRLVPTPLPGAVVDPTCGSGTVLIERGLLDTNAPLIGIDVSPVAIRAAHTNVKTAGLADRTELRQADVRDGAVWTPCGVIMANLPFGLRTARQDVDIDSIYHSILTNAQRFLEPGGRVLLATANRSALERALLAALPFRVLARYRIQSGGLFIHITVLGRR